MKECMHSPAHYRSRLKAYEPQCRRRKSLGQNKSHDIHEDRISATPRTVTEKMLREFYEFFNASEGNENKS